MPSYRETKVWKRLINLYYTDHGSQRKIYIPNVIIDLVNCT